METLTEEKLRELESTHGEVRAFVLAAQDIVLKTPPRHEWKRYLTMAVEGKKIDAMQTLASACVLFPSQSAYTALLDRKPAVLGNIVEKLSEMAGANEEMVAKKFE